MATILLTYPEIEINAAQGLFQSLQNIGYELIMRGYKDGADIGTLFQGIGNFDAVVYLRADEILGGDKYAIDDLLNARANDFSELIIYIVGPNRAPYVMHDKSTLYLDDPDLVLQIDSLIKQHLGTQLNANLPNDAIASAFTINQPVKESNNPKGDSEEQEPYGSPKYWLLKINPENWNIENFKDGYQASFNRRDSMGKRRPDDQNFSNIKKGDKVFGYAFGNKKTIECVFDVTKGDHMLHEGGPGISIVITNVFKPAVPLNLFEGLLPFADKLDGNAPERLLPITKKTFNDILTLAADVIEWPDQYIDAYTTEGNHKETEDHLSFTHDIESFGTVICLKKVQPPLAIALFGRWGSGKSFFMQKLADYIDKLAITGDGRYVQHIVQVKFNSWHYSDANLWASLITDIFDSLNNYAAGQGQEDEIKKLSDSLQLTGLQKEATEQKKKELQDKVDELQAQQQQKRDKLEDISGIKLLKLAISDKQIQDDLANLDNDGLKGLIKQKETLDGYIKTVNSFENQLKFFISQLKEVKGKRWWLIIGFAVFAFSIYKLVNKNFMHQWNDVTVWVSVNAAVILAYAAKIIPVIKQCSETLSTITKRLTSLKKTIDSRPQETDPQLAGLKSQLTELTGSLTALDNKIADTQKQIGDISSGKKLMEFINNRSRDENYTRQLGLISMIRKDFETLDKLLREQHQLSGQQKSAIVNEQDVQLKIDRIVLYIDDLDRCNEDIVVKVLEAIHLLLAFPLFVVVVGVDPRWLNNALNKKYNALFQHQDQHSAEEVHPDIKLPITSYDYLEKIFQIPFALKPVSTWDRKQLLRYLTSAEMQPDEKVVKDQKKPVLTNKKNTTRPVEVLIPVAAELPDTSSETTVPKQSEPAAPVKPAVSQIDPIKFSKDEVDFMEQISGLFGHTPRTINRYVNIYRIIKSHKSYHITETKTQIDFKATMFLLALILGVPDDAQAFIDKIETGGDEGMKGFTEALPNGTLKACILKYLDENTRKLLTTVMFKKNLRLIARFSFRTHLSDDAENVNYSPLQ